MGRRLLGMLLAGRIEASERYLGNCSARAKMAKRFALECYGTENARASCVSCL